MEGRKNEFVFYFFFHFYFYFYFYFYFLFLFCFIFVSFSQISSSVTEQGWGKYVDRKPFGPVFDSVPIRDKLKERHQRKVEREPYSGPIVQIP